MTPGPRDSRNKERSTEISAVLRPYECPLANVRPEFEGRAFQKERPVLVAPHRPFLGLMDIRLVARRAVRARFEQFAYDYRPDAPGALVLDSDDLDSTSVGKPEHGPDRLVSERR